jgi:DNA-directed RNA polymerase specialized sigma24 family protein
LTRDDLDRLLAQLRDEYQQVIRLRNQDRLPWDVIGQRLGRTATEARYLWIDALSDLHRLLGPPS